jgi:holo-[acyl-carrier protein] synthase
MEGELRDPEDSFKHEVFTAAEIAFCESKRYPARHFAARFAAKEAALKALGGLGDLLPRWREVEIRTGESGAPSVVLEGRFREVAERSGVDAIHVSLTHTSELAAATVVMESRAGDPHREVNE